MLVAHLSDVHLDRPFSGLDSAGGDRARQRVRDGFKRCLDIATSKQADVVTIGGDLWEDENVRFDTRRFVAYELGKLEIPVVMICGNHDPYLAGGNYERTDWPDNVHLVTGSEPDELAIGDLSIWGVSWTGSGATADFLRDFRALEDGRTHYLLIHGTAADVSYFRDQSTHCPFDPADVAAAGFSRCLAGHIHGASDRHGVIYPGSPEPLGWSETGRHCLALIETDGHTCEFVDVNADRYERVEVDCGGATTSAEVADRVRAELGTRADEHLHLRVGLTGEVDPECEVDVVALLSVGDGNFAELRIEDSTKPGYDLDHLAEQQTVQGIFVRRFREQIENAEDEEDRAVLESALTAGLRALDGRKDLVHVD